MSTKKAEDLLDNQLGRVSIPAVQQYIQLAAKQGLMIEDLLLELDLTAAILSNNAETISGENFQLLISALVKLSSDELFGLHTAEFVQPSSYSVLGFIIMNCKTLGEAITKIQPFEKIVGDMGTTSLAQKDEYFSIAWQCAFTDPLVKRHMIDNCLASWLTFARYLTDDQSAPMQVLLTRPQPSLEQCAQYQALFKCSVVFSQNEDAIVFNKKLLELPLNKGNKALLETLETHAYQQILSLSGEEDILSKVKRIIANNLSEGQVSQQQIAQHLDIGSKTLQRRLQAENATFKGIVDEVRMAIAQPLLTDSSLTLNQISEQLGFSEPRSFFRWFQRCQKMTPGQYRRK